MSKRELEKKLEDQHKQILLYEKKLKDVVRAYKGLEAEKNALQTVVESLGTEERTEEEGITNEGTTSKTLGVENADGIASLKEALATLTKEKVKRETALQNDKRTLLTENEALKERLKKTADQTEEQADKMEKVIRELSQKVKRIEADRERELTDHGNVLAEMQQRYAKEKQSAEKAHKQLAELYKKLHDKDDLPSQFKSKEKELKAEILSLRKELEQWKEKATRTPTVQLLQDQINNIKAAHAMELEEVLSHGKQTSTKDTRTSDRIAELEATTHGLTERVADSEREKMEAEEHVKQLVAQVNELELKLSSMQHSTTEKPAFDDYKAQLTRLADEFKLQKMNIFDYLDVDPKLKETRAKLDRVEDEYERYKLKAEAVLRAKASPPSSSENQEDSGLRSLVSQLHDKLRNLEVSHATDQAKYEQTTRTMRERITELERSEEMCRNEMRREMQHNVAEMESELQKQRSRTLDILAEKERELEVTKSILVSIRSEQLGSAPADPAQAGKVHSKRKSSEVKKYADRRVSSGSRRSVDSADYLGTPSDAHNFSFPNVNESRNVFYEDELAKREKEVQEMRNNVQSLDYRMREMEQSSLCKDLQHHEMTEMLKEEIRVLEGKLKLISGGGEMEYLRNIFVQYISGSSTSPGGAKAILKAIGMVLKLSPNEMKAIDKK